MLGRFFSKGRDILARKPSFLFCLRKFSKELDLTERPPILKQKVTLESNSLNKLAPPSPQVSLLIRCGSGNCMLAGILCSNVENTPLLWWAVEQLQSAGASVWEQKILILRWVQQKKDDDLMKESLLHCSHPLETTGSIFWLPHSSHTTSTLHIIFSRNSSSSFKFVSFSICPRSNYLSYVQSIHGILNFLWSSWSKVIHLKQ